MNFPIDLSNLKSIERHLLKQALYYTKDSTSAKDLVQETIVTALSKIHLYKPDTNFKAWSSTILRNTFINQYRKNKKINIIDIQNSYEALKEHHSFNGGEYELLEEEISRCLAKLNPAEREVITLRKDGYTYDEIAEEINIPLGTVKSRIYFARKNLKKELCLETQKTL
ncbi:MAG: RNA polymerase sigma factor (sigma-70 family) [Saprospiraceae bacterium]|jgi:RNA polymerase sigma-70 factor (ECF subfamily)